MGQSPADPGRTRFLCCRLQPCSAQQLRAHSFTPTYQLLQRRLGFQFVHLPTAASNPARRDAIISAGEDGPIRHGAAADWRFCYLDGSILSAA
ncbi:hypothetical protein PVAP13_7NG371621 [Panicum virgatum]|uniref:Uncharacterized protein n=1 Tax=Panicum virgatum TaxID=38727 RepID=A0A8T0QG70_PANVG|nr:hypothetical protein PVAP13_7NG371621 [Panicum virgatum]